ncbi:MAG: FMN-binding protein [Halanaerobiales bacterium]|nr:FMN-binding protein [Halanaerobiales bacterium]
MIKKIGILLLVLVIGFFIYSAVIFTGMDEKIDAIKISNIDLTGIEDGLYNGKAEAGLITVEVEVEVRDNKINDIKLIKHDNWRGGPAESILSNVIEKQSLEVDTISNATASSKVILKAIENSLVN